MLYASSSGWLDTYRFLFTFHLLGSLLCVLKSVACLSSRGIGKTRCDRFEGYENIPRLFVGSLLANTHILLAI